MKPSTRGNDATEVQCSACKKVLTLDSAHISEEAWKKLSTKKRAAWKCTPCSRESPSSTPALASAIQPATLEEVLKEVQGLRSKLSGLPTLITDVKSIKQELSDLKTSCEFSSQKIIELAGKVGDLENRVLKVENLENKVAILENDVTSFKLQAQAVEQRSRLNSIEIKGVPIRKDENLFTIVGSISKKVNSPIDKTNINYIYRVPTYNSKQDKSIIVSFTNRYVKEEFVAASRAFISLSAAEIGFRDAHQRVFINDHLTGELKNLPTKTKSLAKEKNYSYVWVKFGKIHTRKNDTAPIFVVAKESDLNKLV